MTILLFLFALACDKIGDMSTDQFETFLWNTKLFCFVADVCAVTAVMTWILFRIYG